MSFIQKCVFYDLLMYNYAHVIRRANNSLAVIRNSKADSMIDRITAIESHWRSQVDAECGE